MFCGYSTLKGGSNWIDLGPCLLEVGGQALHVKMVYRHGEATHLSLFQECPFVQFLSSVSLIVLDVKETSLPQLHSGHYDLVFEALAYALICWVQEKLGFVRSVRFQAYLQISPSLLSREAL